MARRVEGVFLGHFRTLFDIGAVAGMSDGQLLERFLGDPGEGGRAAFGTLVERHGPMVLGICRRILRDPDESNDAFQATFLILARRADSIRSRDSLGAWLLGVARKVALRARSGNARRRDLERRVAGASSDETPPRADRFEEVQILIEEVARLPERLREPVVLFYLQGQSYEGAAQILRTTEGAIRGRLARARDRLKVRLEGRGFSLGLPGSISLARTLFKPPPWKLVESTIRPAMRIAAGDSIRGLVSTSVENLMEGALKVMISTKWLSTTLALAVPIGLLTLAAGLYVQAGQKPENGTAAPHSRAAKEQAEPRSKVDIPAELLGGRLIRSAEVSKDCMILSYLPGWAFGNVDNLGIANNDGGVRTLVNWPEVPASEAKSANLKFCLAFYSRKTTSHPKPGPILAFELTSDWPERSSWKTRPAIEPEPVATTRFEPGEGWKLIDITSVVRDRGGKPGNGLMLRFLSEDQPGGGDWSGYEFVSREGQGEWTNRRPRLLVIEPALK